MNISPLDMQVIIPKSTEVAKLQHVRDQQSVVQHEQGAVKFEQQSDAKLTQVQTSEKSEGQKIKDQQKKEKEKKESEKRNANRKEEETEEISVTDTIRGRNIDIRM